MCADDEGSERWSGIRLSAVRKAQVHSKTEGWSSQLHLGKARILPSSLSPFPSSLSPSTPGSPPWPPALAAPSPAPAAPPPAPAHRKTQARAGRRNASHSSADRRAFVTSFLPWLGLFSDLGLQPPIRSSLTVSTVSQFCGYPPTITSLTQSHTLASAPD
jgi:hypothetical protein